MFAVISEGARVIAEFALPDNRIVDVRIDVTVFGLYAMSVILSVDIATGVTVDGISTRRVRGGV